MNPTVRKVLVVGGNGFLGSAVCKAALARGMQVTSVSSSGIPYRTPKGHAPAWTSKVNWQQGNALHPRAFAHLLPEMDGVVHTLGTLLENPSYKKVLRGGSLPNFLSDLFQEFVAGSNPLDKTKFDGNTTEGYEALNRDSALLVCKAFLSSATEVEPSWKNYNRPRPFIYVSAEDIFQPWIPARYIQTKREAEHGIEEMMVEYKDFRGVYIRPSLIYHAHFRPLTIPAAVMLDFSATLHKKIPATIPTPSSILRSIGSMTPARGSSALQSMANALTIPPVHVDHVAEAICVALDSQNDVRGVVGLQRIRELIGWTEHVLKSEMT